MHSPKTQIQYQKIHLRKRMYSEITQSATNIKTTLNLKRYKYSNNTANLCIYQQLMSNLKTQDYVSDFSLVFKKDAKKIKSTDELILDECKRHQFKAKLISKSLFNHRPNITYIVKKSLLIKEDKNKNLVRKFKARPIPPLTVMEVKKSSKSLTIPHSPTLHTKERFNKRLEKNIHLFTIE